MDISQPLLADLINDRKGTRSFARLSRDAGGYPTRNRFQQLATVREQNMFPSPDTLRGVARALNAPMSEVVLAAARSVGLEVPPEDPTVLVIGGAGILPPDAKETLFALARELIKAHQGIRGQRAADHGGEDDPPHLIAL